MNGDLKHRGRLSQLFIYLGKFLRMFVYQSDWKVIPMGAIIAGVVTFVVGQNMFVTQEGTLMGVFALVCVCIWNGFFNSIQVIEHASSYSCSIVFAGCIPVRRQIGVHPRFASGGGRFPGLEESGVAGISCEQATCKRSLVEHVAGNHVLLGILVWKRQEVGLHEVLLHIANKRAFLDFIPSEGFERCSMPGVPEDLALTFHIVRGEADIRDKVFACGK